MSIRFDSAYFTDKENFIEFSTEYSCRLNVKENKKKNRIRKSFGKMDGQKERPQIYWSQNDSEINIKVDLKLDDLVIKVFFSLFVVF